MGLSHAPKTATSTICGISPLFKECNLLAKTNVVLHDTISLYNLTDLMKFYKLKPKVDGTSESATAELIDKILGKKDPKLEVKVLPTASVPCFKLLPQSVYTNLQLLYMFWTDK